MCVAVATAVVSYKCTRHKCFHSEIFIAFSSLAHLLYIFFFIVFYSTVRSGRHHHHFLCLYSPFLCVVYCKWWNAYTGGGRLWKWVVENWETVDNKYNITAHRHGILQCSIFLKGVMALVFSSLFHIRHTLRLIVAGDRPGLVWCVWWWWRWWNW